MEIAKHHPPLETDQSTDHVDAPRRAYDALAAVQAQYDDLFESAPIGYLTISHDDSVTAVNQSALALLATTSQDLLQRPFSDFVYADDQDTYQLHRQAVFGEGSRPSCELRLVRGDGAAFYARLRSVPLASNGRDVEQCRTVLDDISDHVRVDAALRQRNQELTALNNITAALNHSLELPQVLDTIRRLLIEELEIPGGAILTCDQEEQELELRASWGLPPELLARLARLTIDDSPYKDVIRNQDCVSWNDYREIKFYLDAHLDAAQPDWVGHLCLPLAAGDKIKGVMCLFKIVEPFDAHELHFCRNLGRQVGVALENAELFEQVREGRERLRHLAQRIVSAEEAERYRVSRELHDEAGQALTVLKFTLQFLLRKLSVDEIDVAEFRQHLVEAIVLSEKTMADIRRLAHDLQPSALEDLGLNPALEGLCHDFAERIRLQISYSGQDVGDLSDAIEITLYRLLQEALTNVLKHADAGRIDVVLQKEKDDLCLVVSDDGEGFDVDDGVDEGHGLGMGLLGMQERLEAVGGELLVESTPGLGTRLMARIPLDVIDNI